MISFGLNPFQGLVGVSTEVQLYRHCDGYPSQSLSGFGWCFYPTIQVYRQAMYPGLNPFQGLVGVSTRY